MKITVKEWFAKEAQNKAGKYLWAIAMQKDAILDGFIEDTDIRIPDYEFRKEYTIGYSFFGRVTKTTEKAICLVARAYSYRDLAPRTFTLWIPKSAVYCIDGAKFTEDELNESMDAQTLDEEAGIIRA